MDESDWGGKVLLAKEGVDRFIFLGSISHAWVSFVDSHLGTVCHGHLDEFVAFAQRCLNGAPLAVGVLRVLSHGEGKKRAANALQEKEFGKFCCLLEETCMDHGNRCDSAGKKFSSNK